MKSIPAFFRLTPRYFNVSSNSNKVIDNARSLLNPLGNGTVDLLMKNNGVAYITLNNEQKKNALSGQMMVMFEQVVNELEKWKEGKAVILKANGNVFCSGGDLTTVKAINNPDDGFLMSSFMHYVTTKLYTLPFITVCVVQGKAIGGGAELTTSTDFRVFTSEGKIGFVQAKMGVMTGWGGTTRLVKLIGFKNALELLSTCKNINAEESKIIGLADAVFDQEFYIDKVNDWLDNRIYHHYTVIQGMKKSIIGARDETFENSMIIERNCFSPLWGGEANTEALKKNLKHR